MKKEFIELYNELTNKKDNELLKIWEDSKKEKTKRKIVILVVLIIVDILVALRFSEAIRSVRDVFIVIATILFCINSFPSPLPCTNVKTLPTRTIYLLSS